MSAFLGEQLVDPQLQAFQDADPTVLRPNDRLVDPNVPAWYDNTVVKLAGAILAIRGLVALRAARQGPPAPVEAAAVAGQAWEHYAPTWLQFAVPAVKQAYTAGRVTGLSASEMDALATDYVRGLGEYLSTTSAEALAEGFEAQLNRGWSAELAWHRVTQGYGLDRPDMRTYLRAISARTEGGPSPVATGGRMLVDRLLIERADRVAETEMWSASESGLATSWLVRQRRGEIAADAMREWRTARRETPCEVCGPMNGVRVPLDQPFVLEDGTRLLGPGAHPNCRCTQRLVEPISKRATVAAGIALVAADTGRVLMIQRARDDKDPASGMWELPGGHIDEGEEPIEAAAREFGEEVHQRLPRDARHTSSWKWGVYEGFGHTTGRESDVQPHKRGRIVNPDDPDGDQIEALAWWDLAQLAGNPAVRPELRASLPVMLRAIRASRTAGRVSKSKKLDDGSLDPYDRDTGGRFSRREYRTRDVTALADAPTLSPEAQAIVDEARQAVKNPFESPSATSGNPFALSAAKAGNPFSGENVFAGKPKPSPFLGPGPGENVFDQTKKAGRTGRRGTARRTVHHVFIPKKSDTDRTRGRRSGSFYMPVEEFLEPFEANPTEQDLIQPGDSFDFDEAGAASITQRVGYGELGEDLEDQIEPYLTQSRYGLEVDPGALPPELRQMFAPVAALTADPWRNTIPDRVEMGYADERVSLSTWHEILPVARSIFDNAIENPQMYVDDLTRHDLDRIYDVAGFDRNENDDAARERIVDHCQAYGVGDDSLADAYADHVVWHGLDRTNEGERLGYLLQQAEEADMPEMEAGRGRELVDQIFTWESGFHPDTNMRNEDNVADVEGTYTVSHVIYRSNLGENGSDAIPWTIGMREASMWPADPLGHPLHGGPYPNP